jgi:Tol biopolymer transport system component
MGSLGAVLKRLLFLIIVSSLTVLAGCAPRLNRFGIVFISGPEAEGPTDIYRIPDNTQNKIEQLTFTPNIGEYHLLVSKNGDRIIFESGNPNLRAEPSELAIEDFRHIYLLDTASKKLEDMTDAFSVPPKVNPMEVNDWSPDQRQFMVITYERELVIMNFDGTNKKDIPISVVGEFPPIIEGAKWSPDGKKLILEFGHFDTDPQRTSLGLAVYDLEKGGLIRQLTDYQEHCVLPKWSPTSQQVVAICNTSTVEGGGPWTVRFFSTENPGQPYERLVLSPCYGPSWSPDGKQIAFACDKGPDQMGLFIINSDGNGIHEVKLGNLSSPKFIENPTWSPDGSQIIYVAGTDLGQGYIYTVNSDGSNNHPLTHQAADYAYYQELLVYPIH